MTVQWHGGMSGYRQVRFVVNPSTATRVSVWGEASLFGLARDATCIRYGRVVALCGGDDGRG